MSFLDLGGSKIVKLVLDLVSIDGRIMSGWVIFCIQSEIDYDQRVLYVISC